MIYVKNLVKFINGCKANNDTYKTAKIFWQQTASGLNYSFAIDLRHSLMELHLMRGACAPRSSSWPNEV